MKCVKKWKSRWEKGKNGELHRLCKSQYFFENVQANRISNRVALKRAEMFLWIQFMQVRRYEFHQ